jgi:hypothetical protein
VSSKKKRLAGRLAKYVILDSGSWAFAKRADRSATSKVRNSGPLDVEPIATLLVETARVDLEDVEGEGGRLSDARQRVRPLYQSVVRTLSSPATIDDTKTIGRREGFKHEYVQTTPTQLAGSAHKNHSRISNYGALYL